MTLRRILSLPNIAISKGAFGPYSPEYKFGFNAAVGITEQTIWTQSSRYVWPTSASTMTVSSADANDTLAGTGARTVQVYGLDANYLEINETVTLTGQTEVTTAGSYIRVFRAVVRSGGSGGTNAGIIYVGTGTVTSGVPANVYTAISVGEAQTLQAFYTIPANKSAFLIAAHASSFGNQNAVATIRLRARALGETFQTRGKFLVTRGDVSIPRFYPTQLLGQTDIEITGTADSGTLDVSASFELLLETS